LLARPALVVESSDALGLAAHVRHDEAEPLAVLLRPGKCRNNPANACRTDRYI
jgi:hypothetical protein